MHARRFASRDYCIPIPPARPPVPRCVVSPSSLPFPRQCYPKYLTPIVSPRLALLCLAASIAIGQTPQTPLAAPQPPATPRPSALLDAMAQELNRNFTVLKEKADPPPYFLS